MTPFEVLLTRVGALAGEPRTVRLIFVMARASEDAVSAVRERYPDWIVEPTDRKVVALLPDREVATVQA